MFPYPAIFNQTQPTVGDIVLDLRFDGTNGQTTTVDSSSYAHTVTFFTTAKLQTDRKKYGTASLRCSTTTGETGYVLVTGSNNLKINNSEDFCVEMWFYRLSSLNTQGGLITLNPASIDRPHEIVVAGGGVPGRTSNNANFTAGPSATAGWFGDAALDSWNHVALTRSSGTIRGYLNGVLGFTRTNNNINTSSLNGDIWIGRFNNANTANNENFDGWIDSVRITKGTPKYTTNFNPETDTGLAY